MYREPLKNPVIFHFFARYFLPANSTRTNKCIGRVKIARQITAFYTGLRFLRTWRLGTFKLPGRTITRAVPAKLMNEGAASHSPTLHPDGRTAFAEACSGNPVSGGSSVRAGCRRWRERRKLCREGLRCPPSDAHPSAATTQPPWLKPRADRCLLLKTIPFTGAFLGSAPGELRFFPSKACPSWKPARFSRCRSRTPKFCRCRQQ